MSACLAGWSGLLANSFCGCRGCCIIGRLCLLLCHLLCCFFLCGCVVLLIIILQTTEGHFIIAAGVGRKIGGFVGRRNDLVHLHLCDISRVRLPLTFGPRLHNIILMLIARWRSVGRGAEDVAAAAPSEDHNTYNAAISSGKKTREEAERRRLLPRLLPISLLPSQGGWCLVAVRTSTWKLGA